MKRAFLNDTSVRSTSITQVICGSHSPDRWVAAFHSWRKRGRTTERPAPIWTSKPADGYRGGEAAR